MPTDVRPKNYTPGKHEAQTHGKGIGVPKDPSPNMPRGGGSGEHESQPHGHGIGVPTRSNPVKNMGIRGPDSSGGIFKTRGPVLRNSGVAGAHRVGCRKK